MKKTCLILFLCWLAMAASCSGSEGLVAPVVKPEVVNEFSHDARAFTQGLIFYEGRLFESTGQYGESELREVELETGKVIRRRPLGDRYFGEGLAMVGDRLFVLTWKAGRAFVFERDTFKPIRSFTYWTEGWGLLNRNGVLIMSDGSAQLTFRKSEDFSELFRVTVMDGDQPVGALNELEWVEGEIWANIWQTDRIARISPETGEVIGWVDLTGLLSRESRTGREDVLNGIAYDSDGKRLFVTGKYWPKLFELKLPDDF